MTPPASPLPWKYDADFNELIDSKNNCIGEIYSDHDAAFIVAMPDIVKKLCEELTTARHDLEVSDSLKDDLENHLAEIRKALEFYAGNKAWDFWQGTEGSTLIEPSKKLKADGGKRARAALAGEKP